MNVIPVHPEGLLGIWSEVEPFVDRVAGGRDDGYSNEDVLTELQNARMHLWVVVEDDQRIVAVAVTRIATYPQLKTLNIVGLAGDGVKHWFDALMDFIEGYAKEIGCRYVAGIGRKGWRRLAAHRGYKPASYIVRKQVA